jgi:hypothetical protein
VTRRIDWTGSQLNLRSSAIDEELDTGDVARVFRREEGNRRGDLVLRAGSAKRRRARCLRVEALDLLVAEAGSPVPWRDDRPWGDDVDADAAVFEFHRPTPREGASATTSGFFGVAPTHSTLDPMTPMINVQSVSRQESR